jgi:peptidoglycan/LPS O-acetylase OafA/YrhL
MGSRRDSLRSLEGLRFLSSVAIVIYHLAPYLAQVKSVDETAARDLYLFVDLFFVISGVVIGRKYADVQFPSKDYWRFLKARFARLYPLHLATLLFFVIVGLAVVYGGLQIAEADHYDFTPLIANLLMVHAWGFTSHFSFNFVSWSISAEMFVYFTLPLWVAGARGLRFAWAGGLVFVAVLSILGHAWSYFWLRHGFFAMTYDFGFVRAMPSFAFGVWLSLYAPLIASRVSRDHLAIWLHFALAVVAAMLAVHVNPNAIALMFYLIVAIALLCDLEGVPNVVSWRLLSSQGVYTYSIYMIHPVMIAVIMQLLLPRWVGTGRVSIALAAGVTFVATYALSRASYAYFETPLRKLVNGRVSAPSLRGKQSIHKAALFEWIASLRSQ